MTAPPALRPPEPMATVWLARKPGAKPIDVIVGEAEAERAIADLSAALAAIRAGKRAIADMLAPRGEHPYPPAPSGAGAGFGGDAIIFCGKSHPDGVYCELDDGHPGVHLYLDTNGFEVTWGDNGSEARFAAAAADDEGDDPTIDPDWPGDPAPDEAVAADADAYRASVAAEQDARAHAPSVSDEVRAGMLAELRSRPGHPHGGGRYQETAQRAIDERIADEAIASGQARDPDGDGEALPVSYLPLPGPKLAADWHPTVARMREQSAISVAARDARREELAVITGMRFTP